MVWFAAGNESPGYAMMLRFGEWLPDLPDLENPGALEALNCVPLTKISYGPWFALQEAGDALTARCQGAFSARGTDGTVFVTAGDATKLYQWSGSAWSDVSQAATTYACATEDMWQFTQFGNTVIAVNGTDSPQKWTIASSTAYADLGGSPPVGRFVCTIKDFVQIGRISTAKNRVTWSEINDAEGWTDGTNQSDSQDLPEGGQVMGMVGGEFGTVFMEHSIYRQTYVGAPAVFQFDRISENIGCVAENSIAAYQSLIFFLSSDGFNMMLGGQEIRPIGDQKIDRFFWSDVNQAYLYRVQGIVDPVKRRYVVCYPSNSSSDGTPDSVLFYSWTLDRWSHASQSMDYLFSFLSNQGYNTDTIDTVITNTDATTFLIDSSQFLGSGQASFAAFSTNKKVATFEGASLAATIDTTEAQLTPGGRTFVREVWPKVDGGTVTVALGTRDLPGGSIVWSSDVSANSVGFCPVRSNARYHRARVKIAAGGTWTHAQGIDGVFDNAGMY